VEERTLQDTSERVIAVGVGLGAAIFFYANLAVLILLRRHDAIFKEYLIWLKGERTYTQLFRRSEKGFVRLLSKIMILDLFVPNEATMSRLNGAPEREVRSRLLVGQMLHQAWHLLYVGRRGLGYSSGNPDVHQSGSLARRDCSIEQRD
jgi:hypothetical protein